jgi:ATP-binding cassette subfamily B protein
MAAAVALASLAALLWLVPHGALGLVLAKAVGPGLDWEEVAGLAGGAIVAAIAGRACFAAATHLSHSAAFTLQRNLRLSLSRKPTLLPLGLVADTTKGDLRVLLVDDLETLEDGIAHLVPEVAAAVATPVFILAILFAADWQLAALAALPLLLGLVSLHRMTRAGVEPTRRNQATAARLSTVVAETADTPRTLHAFNHDGQARARCEAVFAGMTRATEHWVRKAVLPGAAAQILLSGQLIFLVPGGLSLAATGEVFPPEPWGLSP